jgi:hypothetical protein
VGRQARDDGFWKKGGGLSYERWQFWQERFRSASFAEGVSKEARRLAWAAVETMKRAEIEYNRAHPCGPPALKK